MAFLPRIFRAYIKNDVNAKEGETITETIVVDASLSENHIYRNTSSSIQVEDGSKISDHITIEPDRLEMTILFSDTPTSNYDPTEQFDSEEGRSKKLFEKLKAIRDKKQIVTVITGLIPHRGVSLTELSVLRQSGDGKKIECRCIFEQIPRVTKEGNIPPQKEDVIISTDVNHTAVGLVALGTISVGTGIGAIIEDIF